MDYENGTRIWFANGEDEELVGTINGPQVEDYVPVWCPAKDNTIFVHISNIVSSDPSPSVVRKIFEA